MSEFNVNSKFAQKYDRYRQKEELQRLKDRYGDEESSESSSGDSEVELDPEVERDFYRTLSLLKKKDPKIYQADAKFYSENASTGDEKPSTSKKVEKPMYLRDYERKVILEKEGKFEDEDDSDDEEEAARRLERAASPSYIQEQRELKDGFRKFIQDSEDEGEEEASEGAGQSGFLTRRIKTREETDKEEEDYVDWLKGHTDLEGPEEVKDMKYLRDYWNDPALDERERFLRDYFLNKGYLDKDAEGGNDRIPTYEEVLQDDVEDSAEEGETFLEQQEDFERKYNFRYEEPDSQKIKTYPRSIATSVRSKDERRKLKRDEVKERKDKEKEQKRENLKQLKNLKRNEIMEKLKKLQELTGNEQLAFDQTDLEGEFDPQQHDQLMQKFFGNEYYGREEEEKPQFDDEELEEPWNWDTWTGEDRGEHHDYGASEPHCDDDNFIMDADYDPNQQTASQAKKKKQKERKKMKKDDLPQMGKKRKKSHFAEVVTKSKPVFDPQEKSFEQYLDEYYKLDYEDIIDDLPCRFRYRQVLANDFGLSTDEILHADDKELNTWCSLKKTCMFRSDKEEKSDLKNYQIKAQNHKRKREILSSMYFEERKELDDAKTKAGKKRGDGLKDGETRSDGLKDGETRSDRLKDGETRSDRLKDGETQDGAAEGGHVDSPRGTLAQALAESGDDEEILKPKKKKVELQEEAQVAVTAVEAADKAEVKTRTERPTWPKKKLNVTGGNATGGRQGSGSMGVTIGGREFSRQRLKAYGLNPKRLFFRQLGRQKRKEREKEEKRNSKE
ncbi:protein KRI1 homolog [Pseudoliparis swirei]|uniref:protein KRI1 homolog n=1 Tax=Pseudoliparis swirei TaxID=2059687 RepID=UPI0024BE6F64|nr:protein KRI1 homolog [Pseudoliparis swirei]